MHIVINNIRYTVVSNVMRVVVLYIFYYDACFINLCVGTPWLCCKHLCPEISGHKCLQHNHGVPTHKLIKHAS